MINLPSKTIISNKTIEELMQCEKNEFANCVEQNNSDDLEFSLGYLYAKGLIGTQKRLIEGIIEIYTFLTLEGNLLLEKYGLIVTY